MSVCLSMDRIMSALYLQQYLSDPFHICTSYQATCEGVSRVMFVWMNSLNLQLWLCLLLTWDPMWLNSMGNHAAVGVSSESRRSSCSSLCYWPFVQGIHWLPVNSPHKGQWCGALMFSLICVWMSGWVNNGEAGDMRCHRAHYDVTVMKSVCYTIGLLLHIDGLV